MKFNTFCEYLQKLENTSKRLEKTDIIEELLINTKKNEIEAVLLLLEGRVFPIWSDKKIGVATKLAIKAISTAFGKNQELIEKHFMEKGDLGLSAEKFSENKNQKTLFSFGDETKVDLTVEKVFNNFKKLASIEGDGTVDKKIGLISELLNHSTPLESKYIIRIALQELRVGIAWGTIRDAVSAKIFPTIIGLYDEKELKNYNEEEAKNKYSKILEIKLNEDISNKKLIEYDAIKCENYEDARRVYNEISTSLQEAFDKLNESYKVVLIAQESGLKGLKQVNLEILTPLKPMLMQKAKTIAQATETIALPFGLEYKYDGFRCQIHKKENEIELYTRNMENVTPQFPDIVASAKKHIKAKEAILDGEILGLDKKTGHFLPFQNISQRIKRKYDIDKLIKDIPVIYATWDMIFLNEKSLLDYPQKERREILINNIEETEIFRVSKQKIIQSIEEGEKFYKESLDMGNEGVVVKDLNAKYQPGNRVGCWLKIKPIMDPLDLVIIGAEWGEGKRATWLTSFLVACIDSKTKEYLSIGKVGTGIKELEQEGGTTFEELTNILKPLIDKSVKEKNKTVAIKPKIVLEIAYEEIQKSPTYTSGYALRFPRFVRIRDDLASEDCSDTDKVQDYFESQ